MGCEGQGGRVVGHQEPGRRGELGVTNPFFVPLLALEGFLGASLAELGPWGAWEGREM